MAAHIGAWLAEAALLEQIRSGTYVEGELDADAANARFFELMGDVPLDESRRRCGPRGRG